MIRPILAAASAFGLVLAAQGASASDAAQVVVEHADLDLSTVEGQAMLDHRIELAARKVCTIPAKTGSFVSRLDRNCYVSTVNATKQRMAMAGGASPRSH